MKLSIIIICKNEKDFIKDCLESAKWADEIVFHDTGSTDGTLEIVQKYNVKLISNKAEAINFALWHNQGLKEANGDWVLYLDADERITPSLKDEILEKIKKLNSSAFAIPRRNFLLGKELHFGGWYPDYQIRLFQKSKLHKWVGDLHEHPEFDGSVEKLKNPMIHLQPEKIEPALKKSIRWSRVEANLLFESSHPLIVWWRVIRMGMTTLFDRLIRKQGFRDGTEGWIESIYQSFHTMIVYLKLWELQNNKK
jgi:glycosyltransferase involved in cell wall biosynthesis